MRWPNNLLELSSINKFDARRTISETDNIKSDWKLEHNRGGSHSAVNVIITIFYYFFEETVIYISFFIKLLSKRFTVTDFNFS